MGSLEAYFDESGTHRGSRIMCVAGYVFLPKSARSFDKAWRQVLHKNNLPFFRMSLCAAGRGPFEGMTSQTRNKILKQCVGIILGHALMGVSVSVSDSDFDRLAPVGFREYYGGPYTMCLQWCMASISKWSGAHRDLKDQPLSFFFESGNEFMGEAEDTLGRVSKEDQTAQYYRYKTHAFVDKADVTQLQAADLYAWEYCKFQRETLMKSTRKMRRSLEVLVSGRVYHRYHHLEEQYLTQWFDGQMKAMKTRTGIAKA